jgi:hypothetical protein
VNRATSGQYATIDLPLLSSVTGATGTPSGVMPPPSERFERPTLVEGLRSSSGVRIPSGVREGAKPKRAPSRAVIGLLGIVAVAALAAIGLSLRRSSDAPSALPGVVPAASTPVASVVVTVAPPATASVPAAASEPPRVTVDAGATAAHEEPRSRPAGRAWTAPATTGAAVAPPASASAQTAQPTSTTRVRQQIDTSNPYGH